MSRKYPINLIFVSGKKCQIRSTSRKLELSIKKGKKEKYFFFTLKSHFTLKYIYASATVATVYTLHENESSTCEIERNLSRKLASHADLAKLK